MNLQLSRDAHALPTRFIYDFCFDLIPLDDLHLLETLRAKTVIRKEVFPARSLATSAVFVLSACAGFLFTNCATAQSNSPERLFQEGVAAQQRGDDATAVRDYRELLRLHPEAVAVRVNLGATLADLKRFDEAIAQYRIVIAADPKNRMARLNLTLAYKENGNLATALKGAEQLHREDTSDKQAAMLLGDCLEQSGRHADAISLLIPLEADQGDDPELEWLLGSAMIHAGRATEGVERIEKVATQNSDASAYLLAGQTRLAANQYDLARRDADSAQGLDPKLAGLQTLRGMVLEQTSDYEGAQAALLQAVAADDKDFNAHFYLGAVYYFKRDMENARLHLNRALQLQPNSAQVRYELALVARSDGQLDAARRDLEMVVHESPAWMQPHVELSALYFRLHRPEDGARERQIVDRMIAAQQPNSSPAMPRSTP